MTLQTDRDREGIGHLLLMSTALDGFERPVAASPLDGMVPPCADRAKVVAQRL